MFAVLLNDALFWHCMGRDEFTSVILSECNAFMHIILLGHNQEANIVFPATSLLSGQPE
jgi:hypothetical protein